MTEGSDWREYIRRELIDLEERADSLTSDVDVNRERVGSDLDAEKQNALDDIHRHLANASEELSEARERLTALRVG